MAVWLLALALMQQTPSGIVTIDRGALSEIEEPREAVARTAAEWQALWKSHGGREAAASVDFAREMVAGVFLGTRPTGGHSVEIVAARRQGDALVIEYSERRPGPGDIVTQALTSPFHVVRLPRHDGPVRFQRSPGPAR